MADSPSVRRSGRQRAPKKYSLDVFEGLDVDSDVAAPSSDEDPAARRHHREEQRDEEFGSTVLVASDEDGTDDEDFQEHGEDLLGSGSDDGSHAPVSSGDETVPKTPGKRPSNAHPRRPLKEKPKTHVSNLTTSAKETPVFEPFDFTNLPSRPYKPTFPTQTSRGYDAPHRVKTAFGEDDVDLIPALKYRDRWRAAKNLPPYADNKDGVGGLLDPYQLLPGEYEKDLGNAWSWCFDHGYSAFNDGQILETISEADGLRYIGDHTPKSATILMGRYHDQKPYKVELLGALKTSQAWDDDLKGPAQRRGGWIIKVGTGRIIAMEWSPNPDDSAQYLALSVWGGEKDEKAPRDLIHKPERPENRQDDSQEPVYPHSAFEGGVKSPCALQIWKFACSSDKSGRILMMMDQKPRLVTVICGDWGSIRCLKWCHIPMKLSEMRETEKTRLGLLAIVSTGGYLRILEVRIDGSGKDSVQFRKLQKEAFCVRPRNTIATCVAWISSCIVAIGCASGAVALYDISEYLRADSEREHNRPPKPFFNRIFHHSYVQSITSGSPSRPHLIFSSAIDGYTRVTDIRDPTTDTMTAGRARFAPTHLQWCEALQGVFYPFDDHTIRLGQWRRFAESMTIARLTGQATALAVGNAHPILLIGAADGSVTLLNPLRKYWMKKGGLLIQLTWFWHEWSGRNDVEGGVVRIVEGFKSEKKMERNPTGGPDMQGLVPGTIYDEETAITAACWHPYYRCGGWAAVGTASGFVRVEDLAV